MTSKYAIGLLFLSVLELLIGIECTSTRYKHLSGDYGMPDEELNIDGSGDELIQFYEGDMILNDDQVQILNSDLEHGRNGLINPQYRWNTTIAYELDYEFTTIQLAHILLGMADIESSTCLKFKPKTEMDDDYFFFNSKAMGCSAIVGRQSGQNIINLKPDKPGHGCFKHGTILHEIIHALGFYHMHSASDRDNFVEIIWENIIPGRESNFKLYNASSIANFSIPYDYNSVMHYSHNVFSINGLSTIRALNSTVRNFGQRKGMVESDIARINAMYCNSSEPEPVS